MGSTIAPPGEVLRGLRLAVGLTQADVAGRLGVARSTVQAWEVNRAKPRPAVAKALVELLEALTRGSRA